MLGSSKSVQNLSSSDTIFYHHHFWLSSLFQLSIVSVVFHISIIHVRCLLYTEVLSFDPTTCQLWSNILPATLSSIYFNQIHLLFVLSFLTTVPFPHQPANTHPTSCSHLHHCPFSSMPSFLFQPFLLLVSWCQPCSNLSLIRDGITAEVVWVHLGSVHCLHCMVSIPTVSFPLAVMQYSHACCLSSLTFQ